MEGQTSVGDMEACGSSRDGPVLTMINKRLRALRKKYNKIIQIEESKAQGKQINKEQEDVLKGKLAVGVLIEEYEKLRPALKQELEKEIMELKLQNEEESAGDANDPSGPFGEKEKPHTSVEEGNANADMEEENAGIERVTEGDASCDEGLRSEKSTALSEIDSSHRREDLESGMLPFQREINDLLHLLYFAQLFDVSLADASPSLVWTKIHERSSCVSYDCVTEEDTSSPLEERDLNNLSALGSLITSRPANATRSHREALQQCTRHALLWLANSDASIKEGDRVTYSQLRERLSRILSSEYYNMIPELQTYGQQSVAGDAAGSGQYPWFHSALNGAGTPLYYASQDSPSESFLQGGEHHAAAFPINSLGLTDSQTGTNADAEYVQESDGSVKDDIEAGTSYSTIEIEQQEDLESGLDKPPQSGTDHEPEGQKQELEARSLNSDARSYQTLNGGAGQSINDSGPRTIVYSQGEGIGWGGPGSGRGRQFNNQRGYFPRNQNGRGSGRGTRPIGSSNFNGYPNGQANNRTSDALPV